MHDKEKNKGLESMPIKWSTNNRELGVVHQTPKQMWLDVINVY